MVSSLLKSSHAQSTPSCGIFHMENALRVWRPRGLCRFCQSTWWRRSGPKNPVYPGVFHMENGQTSGQARLALPMAEPSWWLHDPLRVATHTSRNMVSSLLESSYAQRAKRNDVFHMENAWRDRRGPCRHPYGRTFWSERRPDRQTAEQGNFPYGKLPLRSTNPVAASVRTEIWLARPFEALPPFLAVLPDSLLEVVQRPHVCRWLPRRNAQLTPSTFSVKSCMDEAPRLYFRERQLSP